MLYDKLKKHASSGTYPMHMPGHKRNPGFLPGGFPHNLDITEIHGFDDLHDAQGVLLETSKLAASLYGSREAFMLINGSTVGILAAIGAHARRGGKILADKHCHRSVVGAAQLFGLELSYVAPEIDEESTVACSVSPEAVEAALQRDADIRVVVITSPSYEGVVSDIAALAEISHKAGALLIVDCAHGAHLGFSDSFPQSPVSLGADLVVTSLHKTLPALTQCSLLHVCSDRADIAATRRTLGILQTSSPSYVLMASIDNCLRLLRVDADKLFRDYKSNLDYFRGRLGPGGTAPLRRLSVLDKRPGFYDFDPGKIVIVTKDAGVSGMELVSTLREKYKIELERACSCYAIAMTSICDTRDGFTRLADALVEIDDSGSR